MARPRSASKIKADTIVIGAGPAGLGAALALGDSAIVLESRETAGGLCDTLTLDGAIVDLAAGRMRQISMSTSIVVSDVASLSCSCVHITESSGVPI